MDEWIDAFATSLGEEPSSPRETGAVLKLAREVAHRVERRLAPVSSFIAGVHVGRVAAQGGSREAALAEALEAALAMLPPESGSTG